MNERETQLPATGWTVLGMLSQVEELSGYDAKKWADRAVAFFYVSPALSQIYGELRRLERLGYASSRLVPQDELRNKRLYRITDTGLAALRHWVNTEPVETTALKHNLAVRAWLGHLAEPGRLRELVADHVATTKGTLAEIRENLQRTGDEPGWGYSAAVLRWCEHYYTSEIELMHQLLTELDKVDSQEKADSRE